MTSDSRVADDKQFAWNPPMKTISEIRLDNLEILIAEKGTLEALATAAGSSSVYLSQIRNGATDQKTGKPRQMGNAIARRLEAACDRPKGWMDAPGSQRSVKPNEGRDSRKESAMKYFAGSDYDEDPGDEERPLVELAGTARMAPDGHFTMTISDPSEKFSCVAMQSRDSNAYALRIKGQVGFPTLRDGWLLVVEPLLSVNEGQFVVLTFPDQRRMLAEYLYRRGTSIEVAHVSSGARFSFEQQELHPEFPMQSIGALLPPCKGLP